MAQWADRGRGFFVLALLGVSLTVPLKARDASPLNPVADEQLATPDEAPVPPSKDAVAERRRHLARLGVDRWHARGVRGQGIKIAVLDSGFRGYRSHLGKSLPERVAARSFRDDGNLEGKDSQHGILCAEVIHALAPEAELLLANWETDRPDRFLEAVAWARPQGARLLSCSVIMPSWSDGRGGGKIHATLKELLGNGQESTDAIGFASAGNLAQRHWSGRHAAGKDGYLCWQGEAIDNVLRPWDDRLVSIEATWSGDNRFELEVWDAASRQRVAGRVIPLADGRGQAVRFTPDASGAYVLRARLVEGKGEHFRLVALGAALEHSRAAGSVVFPGDGRTFLAVGAVDDCGDRLSYSACGRKDWPVKPELVAPVPFPSLWRASAFSGTSAAAPQAAGLAALWWSRFPDWSANEIRSALVRESCVDLGVPGPDWETGYGQTCLPALP